MRWWFRLDGRRQPENLGPVVDNVTNLDGAAYEGCHDGRRLHAGHKIQFAILEVSQARRKAESQEITEGKDVIRRAASVHMMLFDCKARLVTVSLTSDMSGRCNKRSVRFYSVSERRRYEPSRSVTGSSTYEVRRCVFARTADKLTQEQAAEILGVSVRTVRRWEDRFEADGAEGLYDRRLGKLANNRVPTDTVMEMLTCSTANTGITRQSISTRNLWNTMASPKATTGYV